MRNFGFETSESFSELGINGKNSEFHAAMGLVNLTHINEIHQKRKEIFERYSNNLRSLKAVKPKWHNESKNNYAYYPLVFESEIQMLNTMKYLEKYDIFTRRYFFPSLADSLPYVERKILPVTDELSQKILCLPFYSQLDIETVDMISRLILRVQNN